MYRDTEQSYGDHWTLDVYQLDDGQWYCDLWRRGDMDDIGTVGPGRRKEVIEKAKQFIDEREANRGKLA